MTLTHESHHAERARRARAAFIELLGYEAAAERARAIGSLPSKEWKGRTVYQLRCHGTTGRGPHNMWVPPGLLWALISLNHWRCPYHA